MMHFFRRYPFPRIIIFLLHIVFCVCHLYASTSNASNDSVAIYEKIERDPAKRILKQLEYITSFEKIDSSIDAFDRLINVNKARGFEFGVARTKSLKGFLLELKGDYEASLRILLEVLPVQERMHDSSGIGQTLLRLGILYTKLDRENEALGLYKRAYTYFDALKDSVRMESAINNMGTVHDQMGQQDAAMEHYKKVVELRSKRKDYFWLGYGYHNVGVTFVNKKQYDSAEHYFTLAERTFKTKTRTKVMPGMVALAIAHVKAYRGNYQAALNYALEGIGQAERRNNTEVVVMGKAALPEYLYKLNRTDEAYRALGEYMKLQREQDSIGDAVQMTEIDAKYKNKKKEVEIARLLAAKLDAENHVQKQQLFLLLGGIGVVVIGALTAIYLVRRKQHRAIESAELQQRVSDMKMFALRSQMNPHFVFNCINTAQHFVISGKREQAYEYLSSFASLLRLVLENSSHTYVPLEDELRQIELYVDLEQTRYDHAFAFSMTVDQELLNGVYEIPGMFLQPIIENAIVHGVINRGDNQGEISVRIKLGSDVVECTIEDNGVGRERAEQIKRSKQHLYDSTAVPNIKERLELLRASGNVDVRLSVEDVSAEGYVGTRVTIVLPYK